MKCALHAASGFREDVWLVGDKPDARAPRMSKDLENFHDMARGCGSLCLQFLFMLLNSLCYCWLWVTVNLTRNHGVYFSLSCNLHKTALKKRGWKVLILKRPLLRLEKPVLKNWERLFLLCVSIFGRHAWPQAVFSVTQLHVLFLIQVSCFFYWVSWMHTKPAKVCDHSNHTC